MKKLFMMLIVSLLLGTFNLAASSNKEEAGDAKVKIVFNSWRTEDTERMNRINAVFMEKHPNIEVVFQPTNGSEYDTQMKAGLETGTGPDVMFLRSYDSGRIVYDGGFLYDLNKDLPNLEGFPSAAVNAWSTEDGTIYGVPAVGVTHGIYYHKDIFNKYSLEEPKTWAEFMAVSQVLKDNGEIVFAQGTMDAWDLYEVIFSGLGANFYGGETARQALMAGEMKLTDKPFVDAFKAVDELQQFLMVGHESLDYPSQQAMFGAGQAAMFIGGSWEVGILEDLGTTDLGYFPPPVVNEGDTLQYCFHVDSAIGLNKDSKHLAEALEYVKWTSSPEFAQLLMNELPGLFSYTPGDYPLENEVAKEMIGAAGDADITVRTVWEKLSAQAPSGNALMGEVLPKMLKDEMTPEEAAAYVQKALDTWYPAFQ